MPPADDARLATRLRELRQQRGLSLRALGKLVNYSHVYLWQIEVAARPAPADLIERVDEALEAGGELVTLTAGTPDLVAATARESERLTRLFNNGTAVDEYGLAAERLARAYLGQPAAAMLVDASAMRRAAVTQLGRTRRHASAADLTRAIGQLSGVLAYAALDLGSPTAAWAHTDAAWCAADAAGDDELKAWTRGTQSLISRFAGRFDAAQMLAEDGLRYASPRNSGRARLLCGVAQSAANIGDRGTAHRALRAAESARERIRQDAPGLFGFGEAKQRYYSGSSLIWLPEPADARLALREAQNAIHLWQTGDPCSRPADDEALAHVYAATAAVQLKELEQAAAFLEPILALPAERQISWITKRMNRLAGLLGQRRYAGDRLAAELRTRIASALAGR